ncbi:alkaline phosphatase family protein [Leifsonia sp. LS-T14]|uniref:alkaline phosphatase family protein n=1 Tax=unclassified Leifsonia TaxID=2663824 RepID=UPI0035A5AADA
MRPNDDLPREPGSEPGSEPERRGASRRAFLKGAGLVAAGAVAGGATGGAAGAALGAASAQTSPTADESGEEHPPLPPRGGGPGFDHLVVLMYENRSFDNLLGHLYDEGNLPEGARFEGLAFGDYSNPDPAGGPDISAHIYEGATDFVMRQPSPDPGEVYPHVNTQLFEIVDPPSNADARLPAMLPPYNAPPPGAKPTMRGFVRDYIGVLRKDTGREPVRDDYRRVMGGFSPDMLPVFSTLARQFAVYDDWHCAVPSQTFCNRSFFNASTSHGYLDNGGAEGARKWFDPTNDAPTIFNRLEEAGRSWRVYYDDRQLISLTGFIHAPVLEPYWKTHFRTMSQFYADVAEGTLPDYAFVEPRLLYDHNDMHPPGGPMTEETVAGDAVVGGAISDVRAGELLLHRVYSAIRSASSAKGSNALNTMLLVTFDEHGGTYDHVAPGKAIPPDDSGPGENGFRFDRLGVRVPAIAISAYTARNTIIHDEMHHSAVVATLTEKYGLRHLTERDRGARTIDNAINRTTPRQPGTWPDTHPQYLPANPEAEAPGPDDGDRPLSPPGVGLVGLLMARYGAPGAPVPRTYKDAYRAVTTLGRGLFGSP